MNIFLTNLQDPFLAFALLFLGGLLIFVIIVIAVYVWNIPNLDNKEVQRIAGTSRETLPLIGGVIVADVIAWFILRPSTAKEISSDAYLYTIIGTNLFFLYYVLMGLLAKRRARSRLRELKHHTIAGGDEKR